MSQELPRCFFAKWACVSIIKPGCGEVVIGTDSTHSMSYSDIVVAFNKQPTCVDVCWFCAISESIFVGIGRSSSTFFNHMSKRVCLKIGVPPKSSGLSVFRIEWL